MKDKPCAAVGNVADEVPAPPPPPGAEACGPDPLDHSWSENKGYCNCGRAHRSARGLMPAVRARMPIPGRQSKA